MKDVVRRVERSVPLTLEEIDISSDPNLESLYGLEIPVLFVDGRKAAKYRVTEDALMKLLSGRAGQAGKPG